MFIEIMAFFGVIALLYIVDKGITTVMHYRRILRSRP